MAKVTSKTISKNYKDRHVTLELDEDEIYALLVVLRRVGGDPFTTARKYIEQICVAINNDMEDGLIDTQKYQEINATIDPNHRSIYFKKGDV